MVCILSFVQRIQLKILHRRIADVCFELHFGVTPGQFRSAAVG